MVMAGISLGWKMIFFLCVVERTQRAEDAVGKSRDVVALHLVQQVVLGLRTVAHLGELHGLHR